MSKLSTTFAALAVRDFRRQWIASTLATTAFMTTFVLVPIVAYQLTGSYAASGFAAMGNGVGMFFLTPLGGLVADRFPKKPIVLFGQYSTLVVIAGTGALIATDLITIPLLFASTLLSGAASALTGPARQSWVAELVPERLVPNAVALQQMGINIAQVLGPTMAAIVITLLAIGPGEVYLGVSLLFIIVVPINHILPKTMPKVVVRRSPRRELGEGFQYLRRNPRLRILWLFWLMVVICGFAIQTLMPGILDQEFNRSSNDAVIINSIFGIAALAINIPLAGLVSGRFAWPLLLGTAILMAVGLWMLAWAPTYALILILSAVAGAGRSGVMLVNQSIMMSNTKPEYFGRVMAYVLMAFGLQSIIAPGWGVIADLIGGRETLLLVGLIVVVGTGLMFLGWVRTRRLPLEVGTPAAAVAEALPQQPEPEPEPAPSAPSPAFSPLFAAQVAPIVLMEGQKPRPAILSGD